MTGLLKDLSKEELFNVMKAYDSYINQKWDADRQPVCIEEFYTNEYAVEKYNTVVHEFINTQFVHLSKHELFKLFKTGGKSALLEVAPGSRLVYIIDDNSKKLEVEDPQIDITNDMLTLINTFDILEEFGAPEDDNKTLKSIRMLKDSKCPFPDVVRESYKNLAPGYYKIRSYEDLFIFEAGDFHPIEWMGICRIFNCDARVCSRITIRGNFAIDRFNISIKTEG